MGLYENSNSSKANLAPSLYSALVDKFGGSAGDYSVGFGGMNPDYLYVLAPEYVSDIDLADFIDNEWASTSSSVTIDYYFIANGNIYMQGTLDDVTSYKRLETFNPGGINPATLPDLWLTASDIPKGDFIAAFESTNRAFYWNIYESMISGGATDIDSVINAGNTAYGLFPPKQQELTQWLDLLGLSAEITPTDDTVEALNRLRKVNIVLGMLLLPTIGLLTGGSNA